MIKKRLIAVLSSAMLMLSTSSVLANPNGIYFEAKNNPNEAVYISYNDYVRAYVSNNSSFKNSLDKFDIKGISLDTEKNKKVINYSEYVEDYNEKKVKNLNDYADTEDSIVYKNPSKVKSLNKDGSIGVEISSPDGETAPEETLNEELKKYYETAIGKQGEELRNALHDIIDDHTKLTYAQAWDGLRDTDEDPSNKNNVILLYTGRSQSKNANGGNVNDWNREHVWAKSRGDFGTSMGAGTDIHHLRPTDVSVNSSRGNKDFDEGGQYHSEAKECRYDGDSWEPRDAVKGDVARMIFYMAIRYEGDVSGERDLEIIDRISNPSNTNNIGNIGKLSVLLKWNKQDPVDEFERRRNDIIFEKYQHNRNPFIDNPEWAELINWSN